MCKARRMNDQMMCECGLAWDIDDEAPECPRSRVVKCDGYSTDEGKSLTPQPVEVLQQMVAYLSRSPNEAIHSGSAFHKLMIEALRGDRK